MIRLGIVDDDAMVRTGLTFILGGETDIEVAWQAADGAEALARLDTDHADVLLLGSWRSRRRWRRSGVRPRCCRSW